MAKKQSPKKRHARRRPLLPLVLIGAALVAIVAAGAWYFNASRQGA